MAKVAKEPDAFMCCFCGRTVEEHGFCRCCNEYKGVTPADSCPNCGELVMRCEKRCGACYAANPNADEDAQ